MPVSINGSLKSTTASRSAFIINDDNTISTLRLTRSATKPFHFPFSRVPHFPSSTRTSSYVKPFCWRRCNYAKATTNKNVCACVIEIENFFLLKKKNITNQSDTYQVVLQIFPINRYKIHCSIDKNFHSDALDPHRCYSKREKFNFVIEILRNVCDEYYVFEKYWILTRSCHVQQQHDIKHHVPSNICHWLDPVV